MFISAFSPMFKGDFGMRHGRTDCLTKIGRLAYIFDVPHPSDIIMLIEYVNSKIQSPGMVPGDVDVTKGRAILDPKTAPPALNI